MPELVWRVVSRYPERAGRLPILRPAAAYDMLDGLFQQALLAFGHEASALDDLAAQVGEVMPFMLARAPRPRPRKPVSRVR